MAEFLQVMDDWAGYRGIRTESRPFSEAAEMHMLELLTKTGKYARMPAFAHEYAIKEAVTTSDFAGLFGFVIDRQLLAKYAVWVTDWRAYCATGSLVNFNVGELHKVTGNDEYLPLIAEKGPYTQTTPVSGHYNRQVFKHGRMFDISWQAVVNDFLQAFADIPARFANAAVRTEARDVTSIYAAVGGPNAALFGAPIADVDGQNVTNQGVLALTIPNIETTLLLMSQQTDANGEPISVRGVHLVVPPALEITAKVCLTSPNIQQLASATPVPTINVLPQMGLQLHVDPYLPIVDASENNNGTWYVFADPAQGKAMQMDYLRGYEQPEICLKTSDKMLAGGGSISPMEGDFLDDNIKYRVRVIHGGVALDPRFCYAQVHV